MLRPAAAPSAQASIWLSPVNLHSCEAASLQNGDYRCSSVASRPRSSFYRTSERITLFTFGVPAVPTLARVSVFGRIIAGGAQAWVASTVSSWRRRICRGPSPFANDAAIHSPAMLRGLKISGVSEGRHPAPAVRSRPEA